MDSVKCKCGVDVPLPDDPTAQAVVCPDCGNEMDILMTAGDATQIATPAQRRKDPLLGRELSHGRYRIDSALGEGGMGTVYLGTQTNLNRRVAIKVLSDELNQDEHFIKRFRREAGVLAALEHPNIVSVFDVGDDDGLHYIVMAYVSVRKAPPPACAT